MELPCTRRPASNLLRGQRPARVSPPGSAIDDLEPASLQRRAQLLEGEELLGGEHAGAPRLGATKLDQACAEHECCCRGHPVVAAAVYNARGEALPAAPDRDPFRYRFAGGNGRHAP